MRSPLLTDSTEYIRITYGKWAQEDLGSHRDHRGGVDRPIFYTLLARGGRWSRACSDEATPALAVLPWRSCDGKKRPIL